MLTSTNTSGDLVTSVNEEQKLSEQKLTNKNELELTPSQRRKKDALDMAELIYNIYNDSCPIQHSKIMLKGGNHV